MGWGLIIVAISVVITYFTAADAQRKAKKAAKAAADNARGVLIQRKGINEPIPVIYGQRRVAGAVVFTSTKNIPGGLPNEKLYMAIVLCEGPVESISDIYINGERLEGSKYTTLVTVTPVLGEDAQTADSTLTTNTNEWTSSHKLSGLAYLSVDIRMPDWGDDNPFAGAIPEFTALVRGRKVYDPRTASTAWSANAALCIRDYLTNATYGKGLASGKINDAMFGAAADILDDAETLESGITTNIGTPDAVGSWGTHVISYYAVFSGVDHTDSLRPGSAVTQNGNHFEVISASRIRGSDDTSLVYAAGTSPPATLMTTAHDVTVDPDGSAFGCHAVIETSHNIFDNINTLLLGCRGSMPYSQGQYGLLLDVAGSSVFSFGVDNIIDGISISGVSKSDKFNQVLVRYADPKADYQSNEVVFPTVGDADDVTWLAEDNGERLTTEFEAETLAMESDALNLAKAILYHSRYNLKVSFKSTSEAFQIAVGDVVDITHPTPAWTAQLFRVESIGLNPDGTASIGAREYNAGIYTYDSVAARANAIFTDLPSTDNVEAPTALVLTDSSVLIGDGSLSTILDVAFTESDDYFVSEHEVQWKVTTDSDYKSLRTTNAQAQIYGIEAGKTYDVRVRAINSFGSVSSFISDTQLVENDTTEPSAPTSVTATSAPFAIQLSWTNPADVDLDAVEIHVRSANTTPTDDTYLDETVKAKPYKAQTFRLTAGDFSPNTPYYIFLRAVDYAGNESSFTSSVNAQFQIPRSAYDWRSASSIGSQNVTITGGTDTSFDVHPSGLNAVILNGAVSGSIRLLEFDMTEKFNPSTGATGTQHTYASGIGLYSTIQDIRFNSDWSKALVLLGGHMVAMSFSSAGDLSTGSVDASFDFTSTLTDAENFCVSGDGLTLFINNQTSVYQFSVSTAYTVTGMAYASKSFTPSVGIGCLEYITASRLFGLSKSTPTGVLKITGYEFYMSTDDDISTAKLSVESEMGVDTWGNNCGAARFSTDGERMIILDGSGVSTNWMIGSSVSYVLPE